MILIFIKNVHNKWICKFKKSNGMLGINDDLPESVLDKLEYIFISTTNELDLQIEILIGFEIYYHIGTGKYTGLCNHRIGLRGHDTSPPYEGELEITDEEREQIIAE